MLWKRRAIEMEMELDARKLCVGFCACKLGNLVVAR